MTPLIRVAALLALTACSTLYAEPQMSSNRAQCFGRYLIDLPTSANLIGNGNKYVIATINSEKKNIVEFKKTIEEKRKELAPPKDKFYFSLVDTKFSDSNIKRIFLSHTKAGSHDLYQLDGYKLDHGYLFSMHSGVSKEYLGNTVSWMQGYTDSLIFRPRQIIPIHAGFCFENGFVANDGSKPQYELATLAFELKDHPDVHIVVESEVLFTKDDSLLERTSKAGLFSLFDGASTLRKGTRTVNGVAGEEVLTRISSDQGGKAHKFRWETMGELSNPLKPDVYVDFQTGFKPGGGTVNSSLSDKEAIAMFDQIVNSLRFRPVK